MQDTLPVHVVVPDAVDDPARPSGGNRYDRAICDGLTAAGWKVQEHQVAHGWPRPTAAAAGALAPVIAGIPDGAVVLVDGLIASAAPQVLVPAADRLGLVVLVHQPSGGPAERSVLTAARAVVTTSRWARERVLERYPLVASQVYAVEPGTEPAGPAAGTGAGGALLCVAPVAAHKGQDVLLAALARVADLPWRCTCVGPLDRDPAFVALLRDRAAAAGLTDRVVLTGPLAGEALDAAYRAADVLVHPSRGETYGMVVSEALARGLPVITSHAGGLPDTLGRTAGGRPGLLVPPGDEQALADALRRWLTRARLRQRLGVAARARRPTLRRWSAATEQMARVLTEAAR